MKCSLGLAVVGIALVLLGSKQATAAKDGPEFNFARDTFAFPNETVFDYHEGVPYARRSSPGRNQPKPYTWRCFVMSRSVVQFKKFARFDPQTAPPDDAELAHRLHVICHQHPWAAPWSEDRRVVISGYKDLRELSEKRARVVQEPTSSRRRKTIAVLGTELTAEIQSHAERIVQLHRAALSHSCGHELPLIPYAFSGQGLIPQLPGSVIDLARTPHIAVVRDDEPGPGGTTRAGIMNWEPPSDLPHGVEILARDAQKLVAAVDVAHILDAGGNVKAEWRSKLTEYLQHVSRALVRRRSTALILGCTHFEYFERDFSRMLPTLAARGGIISPSGALACRLIDAYQEYLALNPVRPISQEQKNYFVFSGNRPPEAIFKALGLQDIAIAKTL